jgi:hypothetical protein
MNALINKLKEVVFAVLPITLLVLVLNFTFIPLDTYMLIRFLLGTLLIVIGLTIFLFGADIGIGPIGTLMGSYITKSNSIWIVGLAGFLLGFFISVAEPDLHILAGQVSSVTGGDVSKHGIITVVSVGIAVMLSVGLIRIVHNITLRRVLTIVYTIILASSFFVSEEFLAISFDASGATTGAMTVPFILALGLGVSSLKSGIASEEDSFGLVGIASSGAILSVIVMDIFKKSGKIIDGSETKTAYSVSVIGPFLQKFPVIVMEVLIALLPLLLVFLALQIITSNLSRKSFSGILKGLLYTFIGLVLFLTGVNAGFMEVGSAVGYSIACFENKWLIVIVGFILGLVVILAEPALYVLTNQIEEVTSGFLKKKIVIIALSIGVAFAVALSLLRVIVPGIKLWHYLLPGYAVSIAMARFVPNLFVGIAFDAGGVASGPMTATFILAFAQGAASAVEGANVLIDGFGIIAMVAMIPLISLQILGLIFKRQTVKGGK